MTQEKEVIIFDTDAEAARKITVTGWVSRTGKFYGDNEDLARFDGCTHKKCECGKPMVKHYTKCESCRAQTAAERWKAYPFKEWDEKEPVCIFDDDTYFFSGDEIEEYLEENELQPEDLRLVICQPNHYRQVEYDYWEDGMPEDADLPKELVEKLTELNKFIETMPVQSWSPVKIRTEYKRQVPKNN